MEFPRGEEMDKTHYKKLCANDITVVDLGWLKWYLSSLLFLLDIRGLNYQICNGVAGVGCEVMMNLA